MSNAPKAYKPIDVPLWFVVGLSLVHTGSFAVAGIAIRAWLAPSLPWWSALLSW